MPTIKTHFFAALLSLCCIMPAVADQKSSDIEEILEQTGFNKLIQLTPNFAQAILKQSSGALEPEMNSALSAAFTQAFASTTVKRDIKRTLSAHYKAEHAQGFIKQLKSPIAEKMGELESKTSDPAQRPMIESFAKQQKEKPATMQRTALIQRLDKANRTTAFSIDMQTAFFKAIFVAIDPVMESDMRISEDELTKMVNEVRTSLEESIAYNTQLSYLYAFRDVSDEELTAYIEMGENDDYRWGIQLLGNAMVLAINHASERAAVQMQKASL